MYGDGQPTTARGIIDDFQTGLLAPDTPVLAPVVATAGWNYTPAGVAAGLLVLWFLWPKLRKL